MPRRFLLLACLSTHLAGSAGAYAWGLKNYPLTPSIIDPSLAFLDPETPLGDRVQVPVADKEPYDTFFLSSAKVQGIMVLADTLTGQFGQALRLTLKDAVEVPRAHPEEWPDLMLNLVGSDTESGDLERLKGSAARLEALVPALSALSEAVPSLITTGSGCLTSAPNDFRGWSGAIKLFRVTADLKTSIAGLKDAGEHAVPTLSSIMSIVKAVTIVTSRPQLVEPVGGPTPPRDDDAPGRDEVPWCWKITIVSGEAIYLNAGANVGFRPGLVLSVVATGDTIRDPQTHKAISLETAQIGRLEITVVEDSVAIAKITEGCTGIKQGDILRLEKQGASAESQRAAK